MEKKTILKISDLAISFKTDDGIVHAVRGVNFRLKRGETVALVGESGCGKSITVKTILGITASNQYVESGSIQFTDCDGNTVDLLKLSEKQLQKNIRGKKIAMVFQDPMTSLDPTMTIGKQIMETMILQLKMSRIAAYGRAVELLEQVGIDRPEERMRQYPHQLSGGMRQRVVIAIALSCNPELLICDEPTTALDVTIQARILQLIKDIQKKTNISVIFITHDLGVVAKVADYVNVMYAGKIVEEGFAEDIFYTPAHPYTWGLLSAMPDTDTDSPRLYTIPGSPPNLLYPIQGDAFAPRNPFALEIDFVEMPPMFVINDHHKAATWLLAPQAPKVDMPVELVNRIKKQLEANV